MQHPPINFYLKDDFYVKMDSKISCHNLLFFSSLLRKSFPQSPGPIKIIDGGQEAVSFIKPFFFPYN